MHATAIPFKNSDGDVVRISGFVEDITELKNKEEELSTILKLLFSKASYCPERRQH